jgi:hypothetical protein
MSYAKNAGVWLIFLCFLLLVVQPAATHTSADVEVTCPLCHTKFKASAYESAPRLGMRLDLKPVGATTALWSMPKCPKCHFIVFDNDFSEERLDLLYKFVSSKDYRDMVADNPNNYLLARLYETVGVDAYEIAHAYLKASWQVDKDRVKCAKYLEASYAKFQSFLASNKGESPQYIMAEMLSGEIERRLGKFDLASARFSRLQKTSIFSQSGNAMAIIEYQLELVGAKDSEPHEIKM